MSSRWISTSASARGVFFVDRRVRCLDQRALAGAARAPQQHVVGRQPGGETLGILDEDVAHPVYSAQQVELDAVDFADGLQPFALGVPDEGVGGVEIVLRRRRRRQAFERVGDAGQQRQKIGLGHLVFLLK